MRILSLFSGGGGLDLGLHRAIPGARTVCYVEREAYACAVLLARMEDGGLAPAPIWTDVTTFDGRPWRGVVDCVAGGSPCQDLSVAGKQAGLDGERSGLFFQFVRIAEEVRPQYVFWENVGGAVQSLQRVFDSFSALGYSGAATTVRASDVGAPHQRARIFLLGKKLGNTTGSRHEGEAGGRLQPRVAAEGCGELANACGARREGGERAGTPGEGAGSPRPTTECGRPEWPPGPDGDWSGIPAHLYPAQPRVRLLDDGLARGLGPAVESVWADRLRLLGNGVVPAQAAEAWRFLWGRVGR